MTGRPASEIRTPRMMVRCWKEDDVSLLRDALDASREALERWTPWVLPDPEDPDALAARVRGFREKFAAGEQFAYGLFDLTEHSVLGGAGLFPRVGPGALELGYWTRSDVAGRGYATEAARALTRAAFRDARVERVEIRCEPGNSGSVAIPRKLGYRYRETLIEPSRIDGRDPVDIMVFEMLSGEFDAHAWAHDMEAVQ